VASRQRSLHGGDVLELSGEARRTTESQKCSIPPSTRKSCSTPENFVRSGRLVGGRRSRRGRGTALAGVAPIPGRPKNRPARNGVEKNKTMGGTPDEPEHRAMRSKRTLGGCRSGGKQDEASVRVCGKRVWLLKKQAGNEGPRCLFSMKAGWMQIGRRLWNVECSAQDRNRFDTNQRLLGQQPMDRPERSRQWQRRKDRAEPGPEWRWDEPGRQIARCNARESPSQHGTRIFGGAAQGRRALLRAWDWVSGLGCHASIFLVLNTRTMDARLATHKMMGFPPPIPSRPSPSASLCRVIVTCRDVSSDRVFARLGHLLLEEGLCCRQNRAVSSMSGVDLHGGDTHEPCGDPRRRGPWPVKPLPQLRGPDCARRSVFTPAAYVRIEAALRLGHVPPTPGQTPQSRGCSMPSSVSLPAFQ
jgi:hypothetical protein